MNSRVLRLFHNLLQFACDMGLPDFTSAYNSITARVSSKPFLPNDAFNLFGRVGHLTVYWAPPPKQSRTLTIDIVLPRGCIMYTF